jgi:hypothetical protein
MIQANPKLTPNLVKAIIEYTAQRYAYDSLTQGAGFLNTRGAVDLARFFVSAKAGARYPSAKPWSRMIIWGNQRLTGGVIKPAGSAWGVGVTWGAAFRETGAPIVWGTLATDYDNIVWGTSLLDADNIVWGTATSDYDNVVWGTTLSGGNIVWGTLAPDTNVVWGTQCAGANCGNIVWGSSLPELDNIVWGTSILEADNIVWGTCGDFDNIVWGTSDDTGEPPPLYDDPDTSPPSFDSATFDALFSTDPVVVSTTSGDAMTTVTATTTTLLGGGF